MTDKYDERAAEIAIKYTNGYHMGAMPQVHVLLEMIAAALRDAVAKEKEYWNKFEKGCGDCDCDLTKDLLVNGIQKVKIYVAKGKREAYTDAATIALSHAMRYAKPINSAQEGANTIARRIAAKIEARAQEVAG